MFKNLCVSLLVLLYLESPSKAQLDSSDLRSFDDQVFFLESRSDFEKGKPLTTSPEVLQKVRAEGFNGLFGECGVNIAFRDARRGSGFAVGSGFSLLTFQMGTGDLYFTASALKSQPFLSGRPLHNPHPQIFVDHYKDEALSFEFVGPASLNDDNDLKIDMTLAPKEPSRSIILRGVASSKAKKFDEFTLKPLLIAKIFGSVVQSKTSSFTYEAFCTYYDKKVLVKGVFSQL